MSKIQGKTKIGLIIGIIFILGFFSVLYYFSYQEFSKEVQIKSLLSKKEITEKAVDHGKVLATDYGPNWTDVTYEDGVHQQTLTIGQSNYQTTDGNYKPIKPDIQEITEEKSEFQYENTANFFATYFKKDISSDDLIKVQKDGQSVSFSFVDINKSSEAVVKDNVLTYPDVYPNLDARYTISNGQVLEELILKEYTDLPKITQKVKLEGVKLEKKDDGTIELKNERTKELIWTIPAPSMYEEGNHENINYDLHYEIGEQEGTTYLSKVISENGKNWLKSAKYPVVIDATFEYYFVPGVNQGENAAIHYTGGGGLDPPPFPANEFNCIALGSPCTSQCCYMLDCVRQHCDLNCNWGRDSYTFPANPPYPPRTYTYLCEPFAVDDDSNNLLQYDYISVNNDGFFEASCHSNMGGYGHGSGSITQHNFKLKINVGESWITQIDALYSGKKWGGWARAQLYRVDADTYVNLRDDEGYDYFRANFQDKDYTKSIYSNFSQYVDNNSFIYLRAYDAIWFSLGHCGGKLYTDYVKVTITYKIPTPTDVGFDNIKSTSLRMFWTDQILPPPQEEDKFEVQREKCTNPPTCTTWGEHLEDNTVPSHAGRGFTCYGNYPSCYNGSLASGLLQNTKYRYRVRTHVGAPFNQYSDWAPWSAAGNLWAEVTTSAIPYPTIVNVDNITTNSMRLNWFDNTAGTEEENHFEVRRQRCTAVDNDGVGPNCTAGNWSSDGADNNVSGHAGVGQLQYTVNLVTSLNVNNLYRYQVRACLVSTRPCPGASASAWSNYSDFDPAIRPEGGRFTLALPVVDTDNPPGPPIEIESLTLSSPRWDSIRFSEINHPINFPNNNPNDAVSYMTTYGVMIEYEEEGSTVNNYITSHEGSSSCNVLMPSPNPDPLYYIYGLGDGISGEPVLFQGKDGWLGTWWGSKHIVDIVQFSDNCLTPLEANKVYTVSVLARNGDGCDNPASGIDDPVICATATGKVLRDAPADANWKNSKQTRAKNADPLTFPEINTDPINGNVYDDMIYISVNGNSINPFGTLYAVFDNTFNNPIGSFVDTTPTLAKHTCHPGSSPPDCCQTPYISACQSWANRDEWADPDYEDQKRLGDCIAEGCPSTYQLQPNTGYSFKTLARNGGGLIGECYDDLQAVFGLRESPICYYDSHTNKCQDITTDADCWSDTSDPPRYTLALPSTSVGVNCLTDPDNPSTFKCTITWEPRDQNDKNGVKYNIYKLTGSIPAAPSPYNQFNLPPNYVGYYWRGEDPDDDPIYATWCQDGNPLTYCYLIWMNESSRDPLVSSQGCANNPTGPDCTYEDKNLTAAGVNHYYLVTAINSGGQAENEVGKYGYDNTPLSAPDLTHSGHDQNPNNDADKFNIKWQWPAVSDPSSGTLVAQNYRFTSYKTGESSTDQYKALAANSLGCNSVGTTCTYTQYQYYNGSGWVYLEPNTNYTVFAIAVDSGSPAQPGLKSYDYEASSNIETPTAVEFDTDSIKTDYIRLWAANTLGTGKFTGVTVDDCSGLSRIKIKRISPDRIESGWNAYCGGESRYCDSDIITPPKGPLGPPPPPCDETYYEDTGLSINTKYCYQAQAKNQNGASNDETLFKPDSPGSCKCTLANMPKPPFLSQDQTHFNIVINKVDDNPHGEDESINTEYAICMEVKNTEGEVTESHYININDGINGIADGPSCETVLPSDAPPTDYWGTRDEWGGDNGINVTVAGTDIYNFKIKARNCDNVTTQFGPSATLFLIKNNIVGWAWSANIGWISLNCLNNYLEPANYGYSCDTADGWGVNTFFVGAREINPISGYAWSGAGKTSNSTAGLGWISFNQRVCSNSTQDVCLSDSECEDGGVWTNTGDLINAQTVYSLIQSSDETTLYAGTDADGDVFKSADGGKTWSNTGNLQIGGDDIIEVDALLDTDEGILYAGTSAPEAWIFKYDKVNNTWTNIGQPSGVDYILTLIQAQDGIYAGTDPNLTNNAVFKSVDSGNTWTAVGSISGISFVYSLLEARDGTLYAGVDPISPTGDVYKYDKVNNNWLRVGGDISGVASVNTLIEAKDRTLYAGVSPANVYKYDKPTNTWSRVGQNLSGQYSSILSLIQAKDGTLYAGTSNGAVLYGHVLKYDKTTNTWSNTGNLIGVNPATSVNSLIQTSDGNLFAGTYPDGDVFKFPMCVESAGTPIGFCSGNTNIECADTNTCTLANAGFCQQGYGFCYNGETTDLKYGVCENENTKTCTSDNNCLPASGKCIFYTCDQNGDCPASQLPSPPFPNRYCKITSTANFNGRTNQLEGWMRVLNMKEAGETQSPPQNNWGWVKLGGRYCGFGVDENTVGLWKLNDNSGITAKDSTTFGNNGTLGDGTCTPGNGFCPQWVEGKCGTALQFIGDKYVQINDSASLRPMNEATVEAWIYPTAYPVPLGNYSSVLSKSETSKNFDLQLYDSNTKKIHWKFSTQGANYDIVSTSIIPLNSWTYIAATFKTNDTDPNNNAVKIYINGSLENTALISGTRNASSAPMYIGNIPTTSHYFNGKIDDVRITSRALDAQEIAGEYISGPYVLTGTEVNSQEFFGSPDVDPGKVKLYSAFGWSWQDKVNPGYGWLEFMPAGSLIGIPWLETLYSDIYGKGTVALAPPPRTIGRYTSSYLIQSGGDITGIPSYYPGVYTGEPTTEYIIPPGFPTTGYAAKFGLDDINEKVTALTEIVGGNKNKYGFEIVKLNSGNISDIPPFNVVGGALLDQKVYHFQNGNIVIDKELTFLNGDATSQFGNGTMVVDGDLIIKANMEYQKSGICSGGSPCDSDDDCPSGDCTVPPELKSKNLASVAWFVKGNIYIDPSVSKIVGAFVAMGNEGISDGYISTGREREVYTINDDYDDAWAQDLTTWSGNPQSPSKEYIEFGKEGSDVRQSFLRWQIDVPKGADIKKSFIRFNSFDSSTLGFTAEIGLLDEDSALNFSSNPFGRGIAGAKISYTPENWETGLSYNSADITSLVQSYVNRDEYVGGECNGDFCDDGVIIGDNDTRNAYDIAIDSNYMYLIGDVLTDPLWSSRFEKRRLSDGALCTTANCGTEFGTGGIVYGGDDDIAPFEAIAIDNLYMYVAGSVPSATGNDWRMEKRQLSNSLLVPAFGPGGTDGDGVVTSESNTREAYDIAIDSQYMYVVGWGMGSGNEWIWWIEKRRLDTGALVPAFDGDGVVKGVNATRFAQAIAIDPASNFMYVAGHDDNFDWRIEKRQLSNGALVPAFDGDGVVTSASASTDSFDIAIDPSNNFMYVVGTGTSWRVEKRQLSDGALVYAKSGAADSGFAYSIAIDSINNYMYIVGTDNTGSQFPYVPYNWRLEKRQLSDGEPVPAFGAGGTDGDGVITSAAESDQARAIAIDTTYMYVAGFNDDGRWRIEKRLLSDGSLYAANYLGLKISEGDAGAGAYRSFASFEHDTFLPAQLIIEYSSSQKEYIADHPVDDAWAWGTGAGNCVSSGDCRNNEDNKFGWLGDWPANSHAVRAFIRFGPLGLAPKSDIEEAELILTAGNSVGANCDFTSRIALLTDSDENIGEFTSNPYNLSWDMNAAEVEFSPDDWAIGETINNLPDIKRIVEKFVDKDKYTPENFIGFRLRRFPDEDTNPNDPLCLLDVLRVFTNTGAKLKIKYNSQLVINGIVIARNFNFDREYLKGLEPSEKIIYDGRVVTNTPPGLEDFTKALPTLQQVIP